MPRFAPSIVTASDLRSGEVVYLSATGAWVRCHAGAGLIEDEAEANARLAAVAADPAIVGAYLAEARPSAAGPEPVHLREAFRDRGPSNYPHGKQEARHA